MRSSRAGRLFPLTGAFRPYPDLHGMVDHLVVERMRRAIETAHAGKAAYRYAVPVHDKRDDASFWYGRVYVFELTDKGETRTVYAWFHETEDGPGRFYTVFRDRQMDSPAAAVRMTLNK